MSRHFSDYYSDNVLFCFALLRLLLKKLFRRKITLRVSINCSKTAFNPPCLHCITKRLKGLHTICLLTFFDVIRVYNEH